MRVLIAIVLSVAALLLQKGSLEANNFIVVEDEFQWRSSNLMLIKSREICHLQSTKGKPSENPSRLGRMAYNNHFDSFGSPPPLDFLYPLQKGAPNLAEIRGQYVAFRKTGKRVMLNSSLVPAWAEPATPFLMSSPESYWVFLVYPYYVCQGKENEYFTKVYSEEGKFLYTFHSFPTHLAKNNPYLLVSPERAGCCDSLKWTVRFYDLHEGSVSDYSCPEGFCGDVLFTKLGGEGPFVLLQEIIGATSGVGGSLQTNIYFIDKEGVLSASGKIICAFRSMMELRKERLTDLSPYSISKLFSIEPTSEDDSWMLCFKSDARKLSLKLTGKSTDITPAVLLLQGENANDEHGGFQATLDGVSLGNLPLMVIAEPGDHRLQLNITAGELDDLKIDIKSDYINKLFF
jgi:hypothetical protein